MFDIAGIIIYYGCSIVEMYTLHLSYTSAALALGLGGLGGARL